LAEPDRAAADAAPAQVDVAADMAIVLAALGRLETAVRDGREVLARLRVCLDEMAKAIVRAKAIADSPSALSLLNAFEHRIEAMIQIASGGEERPPAAASPPAIEAAAVAEPGEAIAETAEEPTEVPTVSGVVSRLGAGDEAASSAADTPDNGLVDVSNVAKLTAMVQALRDSMPPEESQPTTPSGDTAAAETASPPSQTVEPAASAAATPDASESSASAGNVSAASVSPAPDAEPEPAPASEPDTPTAAAARFDMAASLPPPEFVSMPVEPVAEPPHDAPPAQADPVQPAHDPLHALKAMSEHERLALFS
jgi:hypothetical protein